MRCIRCGAEAGDGEVICKNCGASLGTQNGAAGNINSQEEFTRTAPVERVPDRKAGIMPEEIARYALLKTAKGRDRLFHNRMV